MRIAMLQRYVAIRMWVGRDANGGEVLERIRDPIRNEARDPPLSSMARDRVHITVCPNRAVIRWCCKKKKIWYCQLRALTHHRALPSANTDAVCSVLRLK